MEDIICVQAFSLCSRIWEVNKSHVNRSYIILFQWINKLLATYQRISLITEHMIQYGLFWVTQSVTYQPHGQLNNSLRL